MTQTTGDAPLSLTPAAERVAHGLPAAWLISWAAGVPWDMVAAFLACIYTVGLIWVAWFWKPWIKPWLVRRKVIGDG